MAKDRSGPETLELKEEGAEAGGQGEGASAKQYWQGLLGETFENLQEQERLVMGKGKRSRKEVHLKLPASAAQAPVQRCHAVTYCTAVADRSFCRTAPAVSLAAWACAQHAYRISASL